MNYDYNFYGNTPQQPTINELIYMHMNQMYQSRLLFSQFTSVIQTQETTLRGLFENYSAANASHAANTAHAAHAATHAAHAATHAAAATPNNTNNTNSTSNTNNTNNYISAIMRALVRNQSANNNNNNNNPPRTEHYVRNVTRRTNVASAPRETNERRRQPSVTTSLSNQLTQSLLQLLTSSQTIRDASSTAIISTLYIPISGSGDTLAEREPRGLQPADISRNCRHTTYQNIIQPLNHECPISQEVFVDSDQVIQINSCRHIFNRDSLLQWFRIGNGCPLCRVDLRTIGNRNNNNNDNQNDTNATANVNATADANNNNNESGANNGDTSEEWNLNPHAPTENHVRTPSAPPTSASASANNPFSGQSDEYENEHDDDAISVTIEEIPLSGIVDEIIQNVSTHTQYNEGESAATAATVPNDIRTFARSILENMGGIRLDSLGTGNGASAAAAIEELINITQQN